MTTTLVNQITPSMEALLSMTERGNTLLFSEGRFAFYADLGEGLWFEAHFLPGNHPAFTTSLHRTTRDEVLVRIHRELGGWQVWKGSIPGLRCAVSSEGKTVLGDDEIFFRVEFDRTYFGGDYPNVGDFVLVAESLVAEKGMERAFEEVAGVSSCHMIHYSADERFTEDGEPYEDPL